MSATVDEPECPGDGLCHGCLKWCDVCGDVAHVCDARLRDERCDEHPIPPEWHRLRAARAAAERKAWEARQLGREAANELALVVDDENARRAYDNQRLATERAYMVFVAKGSP